MIVSTSACGHASGTTGSGVLVVTDTILTAAHVVLGAATVSITDAAGTRHEARIVALDTEVDLAVLALTDESMPTRPVALGRVGEGATVTAVGGASSGDVDLDVTRPATVVIHDAEGNARFERDGYEFAGTLNTGDSGTGVFDKEGRLVAVIFAISADRHSIAFGVSSDEVDQLLDSATPRSYVCNPDRSRVELVGTG